jgi:hypothetical protein
MVRRFIVDDEVGFREEIEELAEVEYDELCNLDPMLDLIENEKDQRKLVENDYQFDLFDLYDQFRKLVIRTECFICYEKFEDKVPAFHCTQCKHYACFDCVRDSYKNGINNCSYCRNPNGYTKITKRGVPTITKIIAPTHRYGSFSVH